MKIKGVTKRRINNWQIPRNKRKLYPVVDSLTLFKLYNADKIWKDNLESQLKFEEDLEIYGIKREGDRRDQKAGGARTYESWLFLLGLIYEETKTQIIRTTLAGEALVAGQPPVDIIKNQLMKLQYPSPYSLRSGVNIDRRFNVRPFRLILRLLLDDRLKNQDGRIELGSYELGVFVLTEGVDESDATIDKIANKILESRQKEVILPNNFGELYPSSTKGARSTEKTIEALKSNANVFINYLEYTQLVIRDSPKSPIYIPEDKKDEVRSILNDNTKVRPLDEKNPYWKENFQRNYGLPPGATKDTRNFSKQSVITDEIFKTRRIQSMLIHLASQKLITSITPDIIKGLAKVSGYSEKQVEHALENFHPDTYSLFEVTYLKMASSSRELDTEFEKATIDIFTQLGFSAQHVGNKNLHPDGFVESPLNFSGIFDTKAYARYSITNDHHNRMTINYIPTYQQSNPNLSFFLYVAYGFKNTIDGQIQKIKRVNGVNGSAITAKDLLYLLRRHKTKAIDHADLKKLFESNKRITMQEINRLP
ncbi:restriction endonuclease FokI C-terminal domain-containing protein [Bacillus sp. EB01]|uniref:restriction endonuclease FokI C-terminal domain-containing protein n=1 Tax=Bacillus sp. EB01 TaxID=1347086 RepID=UPI0005C49A1D|nr:restriction endonuclease FokI C-terminal domain-containing protein [Bacillus sp. EB01]